MLKYSFKIFVIIAVVLCTAATGLAATTEYETITIPILLDQKREIESATITIEFDESMLHPMEATLKGGILERGDYSLSSVINTRSAGERKIVIWTNGDMIADNGEIVFVTFEIIGDTDDTTKLSLTKFLCNATPASGGFRAEQPLRDVQTDNTLCQNLQIILGPDMNNDTRIGLQDAIYALQIVSGTRGCCLGDIGLEAVIRALRIVTGSPIDTD